MFACNTSEWNTLEQWSLTGGRQSSLAISVFLIFSASSSERPLTRSVMYELLAMAEPQPNVLNLTSEMTPFSSTRIWSFITSPHLTHSQYTQPVGRNEGRGYARGGADEAGADVRVRLGHGADLGARNQITARGWRARRRAHVPRVLVVRDNLLMVCARKHGTRERAGRARRGAEDSLGERSAEHGRVGQRSGWDGEVGVGFGVRVLRVGLAETPASPKLHQPIGAVSAPDWLAQWVSLPPVSFARSAWPTQLTTRAS
jgi:hypothetical protein